MCTTGVLRLGGDDYLLFKNKDFGRYHFDDRIVVERDVFGVEGITTWAATEAESDRFSGFSVGANASGLLACDSNVRTLPDHSNYDDLVEIALRGGSDVPSAVAVVREAVGARPYLWGNLVLIDDTTQAAIEVRSSELAVLTLDGPIARTNHHTKLGLHQRDDDTTTTQPRLAAAQQYVECVASLDDVFALLATHDQGDTGICNHSQHQTVYSYVLRRAAGTTTLHVGQGHPCEYPPDFTLEVPFGDSWSPESEAGFRSAYPSARTHVPA